MMDGLPPSEEHTSYEKRFNFHFGFQLDDGVPVHFKGGPMDRVFYYITLVMLAAGLAGSVQFIYGQAYPKK